MAKPNQAARVERLGLKAERRDSKHAPKMRVSGAGVKQLARVISQNKALSSPRAKPKR